MSRQLKAFTDTAPALAQIAMARHLTPEEVEDLHNEWLRFWFVCHRCRQYGCTTNRFGDFGEASDGRASEYSALVTFETIEKTN